MNLPIDAVLPALKEELRRHRRAIVVASPGAGKSTRVPLALLDEPWLDGRRMLMLEPRRIAARSLAAYMASRLNEPVGATVGYRVRMDTRVGRNTRIEVVTEGVLARMLQADPTLDGVGAVLFDEFHERSLHSDLGLALCLNAQALLRDDLRIVVMSATVDADAVSRLLNGAPIVHSDGRAHPVATRYVPAAAGMDMEAATVAGVLQALEQEEGHALVFLPGAGEIGRVQRQLETRLSGRNIRIVPLHGSLPPERQDLALAPPEPHERKVVLATAIAETSLTVEGIRIVVDSGWSRIPRYSPRTGLTRLETVRVSLASADQRRGRAGRLEPGVCYRLWREEEERSFAPHHPPEIASADLSALALELAAWGVRDPGELAWIDPPPAPAYLQGVELLKSLGALDASGVITPHGRRLAAIGAAPRLAHMIVRGTEHGWGQEACVLAAVLQERDFFLSPYGQGEEADLRPRLEALLAWRDGRKDERIDRVRASRIVALADHLRSSAGIAAGERAVEGADRICGVLLAFAYPDRIARRRGHGYLLANGRGAVTAAGQTLANEPWLVAADLDDTGADSRILRAAPIAREDVETYCFDRFVETAVTEWDASARTVRSVVRRQLGAIIVQERPNPEPSPDDFMNAWLSLLEREGLDMLPWTKASRQFQRRNVWMRRVRADWPDLSEPALLRALPQWLGPHLYEVRHEGELKRLALQQILEGMLTWAQRQELDRQAPTHWTAPSGSRIPIDYSSDECPAIAVRLQEVFGAQRTPAVLDGKVSLILQLLSPAGRPVQITRDLTSFWEHGYFEVKKDLKGRYPKHYWPDDPWQATPTSRVRPNR